MLTAVPELNDRLPVFRMPGLNPGLTETPDPVVVRGCPEGIPGDC